MNKDNATNIGNIKFDSIEWYIPHYTPSIAQQAILAKQIFSKSPTESHFVERSVFIKEEKKQNLRNFELRTQEGISVPLWLIVGFQQRDRQNLEILNIDTFYIPPVTIAHCIMGTEKHPDSAILLDYDDNDYSQGYGQIKQAFRALIKVDVLKAYISDNDFRSTKEENDNGYNFYVFDIRYQKKLESAQPNIVEFKFSAKIPDAIYGYCLILTTKLVNLSIDGQLHLI